MDEADHEVFFRDLAFAVVTLGFYMPYWLWRRNRDLDDYLPEAYLRNNIWFVSGGTFLTVMARFYLGLWEPEWAAVLSLLGLGLFVAGVWVFTNNIEVALLRLRIPRHHPSWSFPGALGVAFVGVEVGNVFAVWWFRTLVILVFLSLPYFFYKTHCDVRRIKHEANRRILRPAAPPGGSGTDGPGEALRPTTTPWTGLQRRG